MSANMSVITGMKKVGKNGKTKKHYKTLDAINKKD